jgi:hypothetical protein
MSLIVMLIWGVFVILISRNPRKKMIGSFVLFALKHLVDRVFFLVAMQGVGSVWSGAFSAITGVLGVASQPIASSPFPLDE